MMVMHLMQDDALYHDASSGEVNDDANGDEQLYMMVMQVRDNVNDGNVGCYTYVANCSSFLLRLPLTNFRSKMPNTSRVLVYLFSNLE